MFVNSTVAHRPIFSEVENADLSIQGAIEDAQVLT
jgi:hypothetical protein